MLLGVNAYEMSLNSKGKPQYSILMDKGKNSFEIMIGTVEDYQLVKVNLTSSFDGLALPSNFVSPDDGTYY